MVLVIKQGAVDRCCWVLVLSVRVRSFQYVSDLVAGLVALMNSNFSLPVNIGNPDEVLIASGQ